MSSQNSNERNISFISSRFVAFVAYTVQYVVNTFLIYPLQYLINNCVQTCFLESFLEASCHQPIIRPVVNVSYFLLFSVPIQLGGLSFVPPRGGRGAVQSEELRQQHELSDADYCAARSSRSG